MKSRLLRTAIAAVGMILCAAAALFSPPLWQGVSGRDFRPAATTMAILILAFAVAVRGWFRWRFWDFVLGLAAVEFITLLVIAHFSGFTSLELFHWFNLDWLGVMTVFIAPPWLLGFGIGSLLLRRRDGDRRGSA
jgi:hypothetical protein